MVHRACGNEARAATTAAAITAAAAAVVATATSRATLPARIVGTRRQTAAIAAIGTVSVLPPWSQHGWFTDLDGGPPDTRGGGGGAVTTDVAPSVSSGREGSSATPDRLAWIDRVLTAASAGHY
jgi:hypothetical protein